MMNISGELIVFHPTHVAQSRPIFLISAFAFLLPVVIGLAGVFALQCWFQQILVRCYICLRDSEKRFPNSHFYTYTYDNVDSETLADDNVPPPYSSVVLPGEKSISFY
jgi:hypothetical protein